MTGPHRPEYPGSRSTRLPDLDSAPGGTDLPARWLVTASIALVHACNDEVRAGHIDQHDAIRILTTSVGGLLTGTRPRTETGQDD